MLITNFAAGELSAKLNGRIDLQQYYSGASRIENFEIIPTGGIKRRVGTKRLTQIDSNSRLIPFILNKNNVYILQCYAYVINIWKYTSAGVLNNIQTITFNEPQTQPTQTNFSAGRWYKLVEGNYVLANTWEEDTTYYYNYADFNSLAEVREIQYAQNYDSLVLVHRNHQPVIIQYDPITELFDVSYMHFDFYPDVELDDDFDFVMIPVNNLPVCTKTPTSNGYYEFQYAVKSGNATVTVTKSYNPSVNKVYCVYNGNLWTYSLINGWIQDGDNPDVDMNLFQMESKYPGCVTFFNNRLFFASTLNSPQKIWASASPDAVKNRYNDFCTYKKYVTVNRVVKDADLHVFTCDLAVDDIDAEQHKTTLRNVTQDFTQAGVLKEVLTNYYISGEYIPVGTKVLSVTNNTIVIDTSDITIAEDQTNIVMTIQLWKNANAASADDYEFQIVNNNITVADNALSFELASSENDAIMFISSNKFLAVGTESSIWSVGNGINATSIIAQMQGRYGSDNIQGMTVGQATIYFSQGKKGIREYYYDEMIEAFRTNDIAIIADQMLRESAIVDFDYKSNPYNRLILTRQDGQIVTLLYDKNNGVMGWNRIIRNQGKYESVAVTRGDNETDLVFVVVSDGDNYYIELLDELQEVYLDSWKKIDDVTEINGYSDEAIVYNLTTNKESPINNIPSDFITEGDVVYVGYKIKSYIKSMPVLTNDPTAKKRIISLQVRFLNSEMPKIKIDNLPDENFYGITTPFSGVKEITYPGISDRDVYFIMETEKTKPVTILSVNANVA